MDNNPNQQLGYGEMTARGENNSDFRQQKRKRLHANPINPGQMLVDDNGEKWTDLAATAENIKLVRRVLLPSIRLKGAIIGAGGGKIKALRREFKCELSVQGMGSTRDAASEKELLETGVQQYQHFSEPLHVRIEITGPALQVYTQLGGVVRALSDIICGGGEPASSNFQGSGERFPAVADSNGFIAKRQGKHLRIPTTSPPRSLAARSFGGDSQQQQQQFHGYFGRLVGRGSHERRGGDEGFTDVKVIPFLGGRGGDDQRQQQFHGYFGRMVGEGSHERGRRGTSDGRVFKKGVTSHRGGIRKLEKSGSGGGNFKHSDEFTQSHNAYSPASSSTRGMGFRSGGAGEGRRRGRISGNGKVTLSVNFSRSRRGGGAGGSSLPSLRSQRGMHG